MDVRVVIKHNVQRRGLYNCYYVYLNLYTVKLLLRALLHG